MHNAASIGYSCLVRLCAALLALCAFSPPAHATPRDDIGYTRLAAEQGASLSDGNSVIVAQSEALWTGGAFYPMTTHTEFLGVDFTLASGVSGTSSHATDVGKRFYGETQSAADGIGLVVNYSADDWLGAGVLRTNQDSPPNSIDAQVANHSWISSMQDSSTLNSLYRMDYLVDEDDLVQVAGMNNGTGSATRDQFASAFNVIMVGRSDGKHAAGTTTGLAFPYTSDRVRPHLVAPQPLTSYASPMVAGAATVLIDLANDRPELSNNLPGALKLTSIGRENRSIYNAETSEVIRAALMAGANRRAIAAYAVGPGNGLDSRYGAGQLDIYNSYHIVLAGEHDAANPADIKMYGFDYDPAFVANQTRTYQFTVDAVPREFAATLSWNIDISMVDSGPIFTDPSPDLHDLNLRLRNVTTGQTIASSLASNDTTENIYIPTLGPGTYELSVVGANFFPVNPFVVDYGLAWRFAPSSPPAAGDVNLDGLVSLGDVISLQRNLGMEERAVWTDGDLNADGRVNRADAVLLAREFGRGGVFVVPVGSSSASNSPQAIPEPSALALAGIGAGLLVLRRRRPR